MAIDETLIQQVTETIVAHFHPRRIILFGSQARGDAGPDSDIDLFIEMDTLLNYYERAIAVDKLFGARSWGMDLIIYTPEEVAQWTGQIGTMLYVVETEGMVVYEHPEYAAIPSLVGESGT